MLELGKLTPGDLDRLEEVHLDVEGELLVVVGLSSGGRIRGLIHVEVEAKGRVVALF